MLGMACGRFDLILTIPDLEEPYINGIQFGYICILIWVQCTLDPVYP